MDSRNKNISIPVRREPEGARHDLEGAKLPQEGVKLSQKGAKPSQEGAKLSQDGAKLSQEGAKPSQEGAKLSQDGAKLSQEGAKPSQEGAKLSQDGAKLSQKGAKPSQEGAKLSQDGAKLSQKGAKPSQEGAKLSQDGAKLSQKGAKPSQEGAKLSQERVKLSQKGAKPSQDGAKLSQEGAKLIIDSSNRADFTAGRGSSKPIPPPKPKRMTVQDEAETKKPSSEYRPSVKFLTPTQYAYMPNMQQDVINVDLDDEMVEVNAKVADNEERHQESCQGEEMVNEQNLEVTFEQNAEVTEETEVLEKVDTSKLIKNFESYFKHLKVTDLTDKLNEPKCKPASRPKSMDLSFLSKTQRTDGANARPTPKPPRPTSQDSTWSSTAAQQQADLVRCHLGMCDLDVLPCDANLFTNMLDR